jgi:S1-C subfamily serine protease
MPERSDEFLVRLSAALADRAAAARPLAAAIAFKGQGVRSGTLWQQGVVVGSEQALPDGDEAEVRLADGSMFTARLAGRDPATNVAALSFEGGPQPAIAAAQEPRPGDLVLALGADGMGGVTVRLGAVQLVGPAWQSRAGGHIDRRIRLDLALGRGEEGGPAVDAAGGLLGFSTLGPRRSVLVIPAATVERVLEPLLRQGRVERGWLGAAVQPVLVPDAVRAEAGQSLGLIVIGVTNDGPAAQAGLLTGDILVGADGTGISSPSELARFLDMATAGSAVSLRLVRGGVIMSLGVTVGSRAAR